MELLAHDGVAVRGEDGDWSYDELRARADGVAAALAIEPGTRVLLHAAELAGGDRGLAGDPAGGRDRRGHDAAAARAASCAR